MYVYQKVAANDRVTSYQSKSKLGFFFSIFFSIKQSINVRAVVRWLIQIQCRMKIIRVLRFHLIAVILQYCNKDAVLQK